MKLEKLSAVAEIAEVWDGFSPTFDPAFVEDINGALEAASQAAGPGPFPPCPDAGQPKSDARSCGRARTRATSTADQRFGLLSTYPFRHPADLMKPHTTT